jgi:tight adherence protein B
VAAILTVLYVLLSPGSAPLPLDRRRPGTTPPPSLLTKATDATTSLVAKLLRRRGRAAGGAATLERAGVKVPPQQFVVLISAAALTAAALGYLLAGPLVGVLLGALVPALTKLGLARMVGRRQAAFADQLDDSLQLMASSLRAGHSLLQALDSVSREAEEPTSGEFSRVINETRIGRDVGPALDETARRMDSQDFLWVTQAIAINREVGGNLADVLDGVGDTIRERNQIRRQVRALSAEGRLSAIVLMALPFGIAAFLSVSNPAYIAKFSQSFTGYVMIAVALVLLTVGALWLRKVVKFKF